VLKYVDVKDCSAGEILAEDVVDMLLVCKKKLIFR
jgi:hypothetical protein